MAVAKPPYDHPVGEENVWLEIFDISSFTPDSNPGGVHVVITLHEFPSHRYLILNLHSSQILVNLQQSYFPELFHHRMFDNLEEMFVALEASSPAVNADIDDVPGGDEILSPAQRPGVADLLGAGTSINIDQDWVLDTILHVWRQLDLHWSCEASIDLHTGVNTLW